MKTLLICFVLALSSAFTAYASTPEAYIDEAFLNYIDDNEADIASFATSSADLDAISVAQINDFINYFKPGGTFDAAKDISAAPSLPAPPGVQDEGTLGFVPDQSNVTFLSAEVVEEIYEASLKQAVSVNAYKEGYIFINETVIIVDGSTIPGAEVPIDGGLTFLALGGIAFGISRVRRKN